MQKVLYDCALASGEDKGWLDSIFHAGRGSLVVHAHGRRRDHMHVRFSNPRAQALGRRVAPLLAIAPALARPDPIVEPATVATVLSAFGGLAPVTAAPAPPSTTASTPSPSTDSPASAGSSAAIATPGVSSAVHL